MKCFWIFNHDYDKWKDIDFGTVKVWGLDGWNRGEPEWIDRGKYVVQERICKDCGRKQLRITKS